MWRYFGIIMIAGMLALAGCSKSEKQTEPQEQSQQQYKDSTATDSTQTDTTASDTMSYQDESEM